jgi:hypothetical protein
MVAQEAPAGSVKRGLLEREVEDVGGPESEKGPGEQQPWWQVVCLTGVDYFSTLGYIPGIAALAAGVLSPIATVFIVLLTIFGVRPMYHWVAAESPHGRGSISMLERLLSFWKGKLFVLALLGFIATDYMITITLSDSDAATHLAANPLAPEFLQGQEVAITLFLVALLGAVFLKGFREAIWLSLFLVGAYLLLNLIVVFVGFYEILTNPHTVVHWQNALFSAYGNPLMMIAISALVFPKLALGVSGFETGVSVMPLVRGEGDDPDRPAGRIRNTRKLLNAAALTMSFYLIATSIVTIMLIPAKAFEADGSANGRALSFLAHEYLGSVFGTIYDLSTIAILWFAGASAMAGLINVVPRYLPRYGMSPEWGRAIRPLVLVYTAIAFAIVIVFKASTDAQAGAYATGVLFVMVSAAVAVTLAVWRTGSRRGTLAFALVTLVLTYTLVANVIERPDGIKIASLFIVAIVVVSLASRVRRSLELRHERIEVDEKARRFIEEASQGEEVHIIAHRSRSGNNPKEYVRKLAEQQEFNRIPEDVPVLFLEIDVEDASEFEEEVLEVRGVEVGGYKVLRAESAVVPNAIAAFLLYLRDTTGKTPNCYFGWTEGNPFVYVVRYILFGEGDTAPVTHEVLRGAEPDVDRRPNINVGGR